MVSKMTRFPFFGWRGKSFSIIMQFASPIKTCEEYNIRILDYITLYYVHVKLIVYGSLNNHEKHCLMHFNKDLQRFFGFY